MIGVKRPNQAGESSSMGSEVITQQPSTSSSNTGGPPPLKLRLKYQNITQKLTVELHEATSNHLKLKTLLHFSHYVRFMHVRGEECEQLMRLLKDVVKKESDHLLRAKAIDLIGGICCIPGANKMQFIEEILDSLHKENNHVVITQIFKSLASTVVLIPPKTDVVLKIVKAAIKRLDDSHHDVRCACLHLIGRISPPDPIKISGGRIVDVLELFAGFCSDQDPRVRAVVYQSLLTLHQRNCVLDVSIYDKVCGALTDDYENVRLAAIKLIWVFSHISPDRMIANTISPDEEIRLLDDAFIKICDMVNDSSMKVRAESVGLLGSFRDVSFHLLQQTLDKKLMSKGRKSKSFNQRQLERFRGINSGGGGGSSSWSTGKTWGDNDPNSLRQQQQDDGEVKLMNTGSCGVFVKSLEDEYMEVRSAGVDSLCELANQNSVFAHMTTDFLVDMFNDEIESVRLNSIHSLIKLHKSVDLREDQLDTILECLNDFNQVVRNSVRDLLSHCKLSTQACLYATVLALLANLKKYPNDRESIWSCMKQLGHHHPFLVSSLVPDLFITHPYYAVPESNIDDPTHIAVCALVFNAATQCPPIHSLLPPYAQQHYAYLRESLPKFIPDTQKEGEASKKNKQDESLYSDVNNFFNATVERLYAALDANSEKSTTAVTTTSSNITNDVITTCLKDLNYVKKLHDSFTPSAEFLTMFIRCQQIIEKCRRDRTWTLPPALSTTKCSSLYNDVNELIKLSYKLEYLFPGITSEGAAVLRLIRILAHSLHVLLALRDLDKTQQNQQQKIQLKLWQSFFKRINKFKEHAATSSCSPGSSKASTTISPCTEKYQSVFTLQNSVEQNLSNAATLVDLLQNFFRTQPITLRVENRLRQVKARIVEPKNNVDNPLRFSAGLTLAVDVVAFLKNVDNTDNIFIKVIYPDMKVSLHKPKLTEFQCITSVRHRLTCKLLLSHHSWTESSHVKVCVVLAHRTDIKKELMALNEMNSIDRIVRTVEGHVDPFLCYIELSHVEKVYLQPKPVTR